MSMGVYIKGMEMPKCCFDCPFLYGRRYCIANSKIEFNDPDYSELKGRYDGCPLVPIPPHGRSIDADALLMRINHEVMEAYMDGVCYGVHPSQEYLYLLGEIIDDAPTIIPAEEEKNEVRLYRRILC